MVYCTRCGKPLPAKAPRCPACGAPSFPSRPAAPSAMASGPGGKRANRASAGAPSAAQLLLAGRAAGQNTAGPGPGSMTRPKSKKAKALPFAGASAALPAANSPAPAPRPLRDRQLIPVLLTSLGVVALLGFLLWFFLLRGLFTPQRQVLRGAQNTFAALHREAQANGEAMGLAPVLNQLYTGPAQQRLGFAAPGAQGELTARTNLPERRADLEVFAEAPGSGFAFHLQLQNDLLSLNIPGAPVGSLGAHTETLGYDFAHSNLGQLTGVPPGWESIGFNLFDLLAPLQSLRQQGFRPQQVQQLLALFDDAQAQKQGRAEVLVNGRRVACTRYTLVFESTEVLRFVEDLLRGALAAGLGLVWQLLAPGGLSARPEEALARLMEQLQNRLGPQIQLEAYLQNGALVRADLVLPFSPEGQEAQHSLRLEWGGEQALCQIFSAAWTGGKHTAALCLTTAYLPQNGVFGQQLALQLPAPGPDAAGRLTVEWQYHSQSATQNLRLQLARETGAGTAGLEAAGTLNTDARRGTLLLELDRFEPFPTGEAPPLFSLLPQGEAGGLSVWYEIAPLTAGDFPSVQPEIMLFEMSTIQLQELLGPLFSRKT